MNAKVLSTTEPEWVVDQLEATVTLDNVVDRAARENGFDLFDWLTVQLARDTDLTGRYVAVRAHGWKMTGGSAETGYTGTVLFRGMRRGRA